MTGHAAEFSAGKLFGKMEEKHSKDCIKHHAPITGYNFHLEAIKTVLFAICLPLAALWPSHSVADPFLQSKGVRPWKLMGIRISTGRNMFLNFFFLALLIHANCPGK